MNMVRVQLDLPEEKIRELDGLMQEAQIRTRKDLFNSALTLLAWMFNERKGGRIIASLDEESGSYKELVMPFFPLVRREEAASRPKRIEVRARSKTAGGVMPAAASTKGHEVGR